MTSQHTDQNKTDLQDGNNTDSPEQKKATVEQNSSSSTEQTQIDPQMQTKAESPADVTETPKKKPLLKYLVLLLLILILGFIAFGLWKSYQPKVLELQGRVEAETLHISTKVPSRIDEIFVHEGQRVTKNQALIALHSPEVDARKQQALGMLQSALALQSTADRGSQQENIDTLYANWQSLKAQGQLAQSTYQRGATLFVQGVISRQRRDEMHAAAISSAQMAEAAYQQYARANRGSTPEQKSSANAQVDIARAAVAEVNALEAETQLLSPINGTVSKTYGKVSELVLMGVPLVSIIDDQNLWISLNIREDQYANVYQAKTLEGYIPALNKNANFKIKNIDAEGEFATIKTTRQTGGYDIRSFKLHLVPAAPIADLKSGMSVLFKIKESS